MNVAAGPFEFAHGGRRRSGDGRRRLGWLGAAVAGGVGGAEPAPVGAVEDSVDAVQSILVAERLKRERQVGLTDFVKGLREGL